MSSLANGGIMNRSTFNLKFKAIASLLVFAVVFSLILTSCNTTEANESEDNVAFTDALGRKVNVKKQVGRVAALLGSFADVWTLAGGELCASAEDAWEDFGLTLENAVNIGGAHSPSIELLLSSAPDLVLASASTASNVEMKDTLVAAGITVAYFDIDCFEDYLLMLDICTDLTGRKDLYEKNGLILKAQIEEIKAKYKNKDIPDSERKILLLRASSTGVKAKGSRGTILGEMLLDIGCINIADSSSTILENLSIESIIMNEPHHVFVVTMGGDEEAAMNSVNDMIKENPAWQTLGAIKENRLHLMDKKLFNLKPNARFPEAYRKLYEKLEN